MTITTQLQINTATDSCSVARSGSGAITIGSVRLQDAEADEFPKILADAIAALRVQEKKAIS